MKQIYKKICSKFYQNIIRNSVSVMVLVTWSLLISDVMTLRTLRIIDSDVQFASSLKVLKILHNL